jgi:hypothetical protein
MTGSQIFRVHIFSVESCFRISLIKHMNSYWANTKTTRDMEMAKWSIQMGKSKKARGVKANFRSDIVFNTIYWHEHCVTKYTFILLWCHTVFFLENKLTPEKCLTVDILKTISRWEWFFRGVTVTRKKTSTFFLKTN